VAGALGVGAGLVGVAVVTAALDESQELELAPPVGVGAPPVAVTVAVGAGAGAGLPPAPGLTSWQRTSWPATGMTQHLACWPVAAQMEMKSLVLAGVVDAGGS
jgi:hypothetical protein